MARYADVPPAVLDECRIKIRSLTPTELDAVITGKTRLGDNRDLDVLMWNLAIDRENGD